MRNSSSCSAARIIWTNTCTSLLLPALRAGLMDAADDWIALVLCIAEEEYMGTTLGMALMHLSSPEASMGD